MYLCNNYSLFVVVASELFVFSRRSEVRMWLLFLLLTPFSYCPLSFVDMGQLQAQEGGSLYDTFCAFCALSRACTQMKLPQKLLLTLVNPASVGQQVFAVVFLTSVDSLLGPVSIFSLPPLADCVLLWTAISSRLFSSSYVNWLSLSSLGPSSTSGLAGYLALRPFVWD